MMSLEEYLKVHPVKARQLLVAAGSRCENCGNSVSPAVLKVHVIDRPHDSEDAGCDLQKHLLILCPGCHCSFRSRPVDEGLQRELVRHRPSVLRKRMREILEYHPRRYVPPGDFDPAEIFRELFECGALDLCLNGG